MSDRDESYGWQTVRIPADVEREDRVLAGLTARQAAILLTTGALVWLAYQAFGHLVPPAVFLGAAAPIGGLAAVVALGQRDGISLDRFALAALRQWRSPRRMVPAAGPVPAPPAVVDRALAARARPLPAPLRLPAGGPGADGVLDLGGEGAAALAVCSTVNFALRTSIEQAMLVGGFGRWLNSLTAPVQILIRAQRLDVSPLVAELTEAAPALPHPALEQAALEHAAFLAELAASRDLLTRQVLLVHRQPSLAAAGRGRSRAAEGGRRADWVLRHAEQAARALGAVEVTTTVLDGPQATAVLAAACDPHAGTVPRQLAPPDAVITSPLPDSLGPAADPDGGLVGDPGGAAGADQVGVGGPRWGS